MTADPVYLSARAAADHCGVSERTIRNWIRSGRLSAEKSAGVFKLTLSQIEPLRRKSARAGNGAEPSGADVRGADRLDPLTDPPTSAAEMLNLVKHLTQQNLELAGRCGFLQAQNQQLQKALEAPKVAQDTTPEAEGPPEAPTGLWGRFLGWLYAPAERRGGDDG